MKTSVTNAGPHAPREYYRLFCRIYESDPELVKALLKLLHFLNLNELKLIENFDSLKIPVEKIHSFFISIELISILKVRCLKKQAYTKHIFQSQNFFNRFHF